MIQAATFGRKQAVQAQEGDDSFLGVNQRLAPDKLPPGYLATAENIRMRTGELEPRKGVIKPGWVNATAPSVHSRIGPVSTFFGVGLFREPDGLEWVLQAADGLIFRCREHNCRFSLPLPMGVRIRSDCTFTQAFNQVYCFRGRHLAPLRLTSLDSGFEDIIAHWDDSTTYDAAIAVTGQEAEEVAYGPFLEVSELTSTGDIATVVTTNAHGYVTGADITIRGANETDYNGRWNITVVDEVTFTFQFGGATSPATGTITCSNMGNYWRALGSKVTLTSLTRSTTTATATKAAHGFSNGQYVTIAGATPAGFNGTYVISNVATDTFDYTLAADPGADASGTLTAQTSVVLAGESPDTDANAWQQIYNVLPNADDALFINNRLLVPTAYTPGDTEYDSTSSYTKKDFIVATDILDDIHFDFQNEFRINQGSDDEIVCLVKYGPDSALVFKGKSWGVLTNIGLDLSGLTLDMKQDGYGACARAAVVAGKDVLFPVTKRGVLSVKQNQLGQLRSVDVPLSNDMEGQPLASVNRINWSAAQKIRLGYWDDKLFAAVPLDNSPTNSALLVFDFRCGEAGTWQGVDTGEAICPKEFFNATFNGVERLFYIGEDGFCNLVEEAASGDEIADADTDSGLAMVAIETKAVSRGYRFDSEAQKRFKQMQIILGVWDAEFSIYTNTGATSTRRAAVAGESFSRFIYLRPFNRAAYVDGNVNDDFATAGRANYAIYVPTTGVSTGSAGVPVDLHQEMVRRVSIPKISGRFLQIEISNSAGRCLVKSITPIAAEGQRRAGTLI